MLRISSIRRAVTRLARVFSSRAASGSSEEISASDESVRLSTDTVLCDSLQRVNEALADSSVVGEAPAVSTEASPSKSDVDRSEDPEKNEKEQQKGGQDSSSWDAITVAAVVGAGAAVVSTGHGIFSAEREARRQVTHHINTETIQLEVSLRQNQNTIDGLNRELAAVSEQVTEESQSRLFGLVQGKSKAGLSKKQQSLQASLDSAIAEQERMLAQLESIASSPR